MLITSCKHAIYKHQINPHKSPCQSSLLSKMECNYGESIKTSSQNPCSRIYYSRVQSSHYLTSSIRTGLLTIAPLECIQDYDNSDA